MKYSSKFPSIFNSISGSKFSPYKVGCVFSMVIWSEFRMGQHGPSEAPLKVGIKSLEGIALALALGSIGNDFPGVT